MTFQEAVETCHVRSGIWRASDRYFLFMEEHLNLFPPERRELNRGKIGKMVPKVYWRNHQIPLRNRVPVEDQKFDDWEEYDPRDYENTSTYG